MDKTRSPEMFDKIAKSYDRINRILSCGADLAWRKALSRRLPAKPHLEVLDLATGTGDQIVSILNTHPSIERIVGIDPSTGMLSFAKKKIGAHELNNRVELKIADAMHLPFKENCFDAASCSFGIRNMPDSVQALKEMKRVLRVGGKALILEFGIPASPIKPFALFYLRRLLPKIGAFLSNERKAYQYLNQTIETYPYGDQFLNWMKQAGFKAPFYKKMCFGAVYLYVGEK